ncbi:MAG: DUF1499 domain-containing protein [Ilumatobacteraceae bacterium]|nr:DUF1499 domain-containing protein [Ilumatobacteraceae bacterium]
MDVDFASGLVEMTATTRWFGFQDDVAVHARSTSIRVRVDLRSVSRVGLSDVGTNAARIRAFLEQQRVRLSCIALTRATR